MKLRIGMVGGGEGAFIGAVHRTALALDGAFELVAGCFSRDPDNTRRTGERLGIPGDRLYASWEEMAEREAHLPLDRRLHAVSIVTPNDTHHGPVLAFLEAGFHVICDKPLTTSAALGREMAAAVRSSGLILALTHAYTGYPMVREARERVAAGALGTLRKVYVEYLQGWLSEPLERRGNRQAAWRTDPQRSGPAGALADIGTHAFNLVEHVTGSPVTSVLGRLESFVEGRELDDDAMVLLKLEGGATGVLCASQICHGCENGLALRLFGTEGALAWEQEHPEDLHLTAKDWSVATLRPMTPAVGAAGRSRSRVPPGHPEGYLEAFANIYRSFARAIRGEEDLESPFPTVEDGLRGLQFVEAVLESAAEGRWVDLPG